MTMEGNGSNNNFVVGPGGSIYPKVKPAAIDVDDNKVEIGNASTTPMPQMMGHPQMAAALSMGMGVGMGMGMGMGMNMNMNIPMLDMSARAGAPALMNPMMNMANNIPSLPVGPVIVPKMVPNLPPYVGNVESHVIQSLRRPLQEGNSKEDLIPLNRARLREDTQEGLLAVPGAKRMRLVPLQASAAAPQRTLTGRASLLYVEGDERFLSTYQCLARKQIEVFETTEEDAGTNAQGRNKPIIPGQVGIRCIHCKKLPHKLRKTGSVYYPNKVCI